MAKLIRKSFLVCLCLIVCLYGTPFILAEAEPSLDETRQLLQKSLTVYEIDREIARLTEREAEIGKQIASAEQNILREQERVDQTREHAGKILRAYYMGQRDNLWLLMFSAGSFSDAIAVYEYLSMILDNDKRKLDAYRDSYQQLQATYNQLLETEAELKEVKAEFLLQRERLLALQQELDEQLAASEEAAEVFKQMVDLTAAWKDKGLPVFRTYFQAIADEMNDISDLFNNGGTNKYLNGLTFQISDQELIDYFRNKNPLFDNIEFAFEDGVFTASGKEDDVEVSIQGKYIIQQKPKNHLLFRVEQLTFNGFVLPDTTNRALEQEFPLGFSPESFVPFINAYEVTTEDGLLTLKLKLKLK
ncbi:hypothetical protein [Paenibacillus sp. J2TS4]|uniref:coiled-coil domain-containing protein n=1 Tax=Paenibacillus sp. J2TS4 TaxID=2807194 RepID=UPI001B12DED9|nr:hypothetical protein [Paenibacillus sp. J2TS4]GIP36374.1 hypothetical protein J2TS4_55840 [Paenibacillus sp. J2TS4]